MLLASFRLTRPLNCLITAVSVGVGSVASGISLNPIDTLLAALAAALVTGAGNSHNDLVDLEIDRINRPRRPLPAGLISTRHAAIESLLLAVGGIALAWWIGPWTGAIATFVAVGLLVYNTTLKGSTLWGNLLVSALAATAFPFGAIASGGWGRSWVPATFAFLFHLGREIVKDIEDTAGDRSRGARTLALQIGPGAAALSAGLVYFALIVCTLVPFALGVYGLVYLGLIIALDLLIAAALLRLARRYAAPDGHGLSRMLTAGMALGLLAVVAGEVL